MKTFVPFPPAESMKNANDNRSAGIKFCFCTDGVIYFSLEGPDERPYSVNFPSVSAEVHGDTLSDSLYHRLKF